MLHGLRPGDNVVLQVGRMDEYSPLVEPFYRANLAEGKKLIYFRFARHRPLIPDDAGAEVHHLHPEAGFERFITETLDIIERAGPGACYVFDCLSDLAVDWYSDRMLGNFFMLACPYLYRLDTIAYFALLRNNHSSLAIDAIRRTAQVVMTVYRNHRELYVHPQKVDQRYSPTMYVLNHWKGEAFQPVTDSAVTADILSDTTQPWLEFANRRPEVWTRTVMRAQEVCEQLTSQDAEPGDDEELYLRLLRMAVSRDERFIDLCRRYFSLRDLLAIVQRMIGTGLIGGKSLGMLLARAMLCAKNPAWQAKLEVHDSFFVGSDVFYTYLVQNKCWWLRRRKADSTMEEVLDNAGAAREKILAGAFPEDIRNQFMEMLNYFGQSPIIVRSSSLLEDNYGNSFSGKYDSVFCTNQGTPEERFEELLSAIRTVYASTMNRETLTYRSDRGLLDRDEQMALLIQRVSGNAHEGLFFPHMAGTAFSFNPYVWNRDIDPETGIVRLVAGLGTRAVDRTEDDYTRLVALNAPMKQPFDDEDARRFSQRRMDVLDLENNQLDSFPVEDIMRRLPERLLPHLAVRDSRVEEFARQRGEMRTAWRLSFDRTLSEDTFVKDLRDMLHILHEAYRYPVDVEFTANITGDRKLLYNLVQCRPFQVQVSAQGHLVQWPESLTAEDTLLESSGPVIGPGLAGEIDRILYVVPEAYSKLSTQDRYGVARLIGRITHLETEERRKTLMLIGPGRWGTRSPSLGVPVTFAEINRTSVLCELAMMHEGLVPDVSLGTHFFNDMVEAGLICLAVFPGREGNSFSPEFLKSSPNRLVEVLPDALRWQEVLRVVDGDQFGKHQRLYFRADPMKQRAVCYKA
ncbi:phosphoenolpyruvate synthase [Kiritimatiella glycovorans]|uniref:Phosphoenolpyruvate synthase n=2 Tax=Kiritimatiella glycovorans TaxID=1307763 RepID=A0A0G3EDK3_9BACT|nr:phosphoenolpyruvate synthase [Kiritimatiella glycovorans]